MLIFTDNEVSGEDISGFVGGVFEDDIASSTHELKRCVTITSVLFQP